MNKTKQRLFTVQKAAIFLGVSPDTIRRWAVARKLIGMKVGSRGDWRFTQDELMRLVKTNGNPTVTKETYAKIRKFLRENANVLQKLATRSHKELLKSGNLRSEFLSKYQKYHIKILDLLANNIDNKEQGLPIFRKLGDDFAKEAVKDGLTIEEAVDGSIFLKKAIWEKLEESGLLNELTAPELNHLSKIMAAYIDVLGSKIAFTYHNYYTKQLEKDKEHAKKKQKHLYKIFMEAPMPIAILKGKNYVYELSNPLNTQALGNRVKIGKSVKDLFPEAIEQGLISILDGVYKSGKPFYGNEVPFRIKIPGKGFQTSYVNLTYQPLKEGNNDVEGIMVVGFEVTKQVQLRQELEQQSQKLTAVLSSIQDYVYIFDLQGRFVFANKRLLDLWRLSEKEALGKTMKELNYAQEVEKALLDGIKQVIKTKRVVRNETYYTNPSGISAHYENILSPIFDSKGELLWISGSSRDITERKELDRRKDDFIALSSHELKTPVTSLKMYSHLMKKRIKTEDNKSEKILNTMDKQIDRLTNIVNELLDASRIQSGKLQYKKEEFEIDNLIKETSKSIQDITHTHKIIIDGKTKQKVVADPNRISQVLINLINNAVKYSPEGTKVIVSSKADKDKIIIGVEDFGIGIPKEDKKKIFDRFYQANANKQGETYSGLGVGLYISKEIVERHDGKIWLESKEGKGTKFFFSLPIQGEH